MLINYDLIYLQLTGLIHYTNDGKCIHRTNSNLALTTCDENAPSQQWDINTISVWSHDNVI